MIESISEFFHLSFGYSFRVTSKNLGEANMLSKELLTFNYIYDQG